MNITKIITNSKRYIVAFALIALMSMILPSALNQNTTTVKAQITTSTNLLQYEWLKPGADSANTHFSAGPAPNSPDVLWQKSLFGFPIPVAFSGKLFVAQGLNVFALDPFTGGTVYSVAVPPIANRTTSVGWIFKIDDNRMGVTVYSSNAWPAAVAVWALRVYNIADGTLLWSDPTPKITGSNLLGGGFSYVPEQKMAYVTISNATGRGSAAAGVAEAVQAWDLSDPTNPTYKWTYYADGTITDWSSWGFTYGDGKLWVDGNALHETCLNASTGQVLWVTPLTGATFYPGTFYQGMLLRGLLDDTFVAMNASTGKILWTYNPGTYGFWCSGSSAAYGIAYEPNVDGNIYALNVTTGQVIWKHWSGGLEYPGHVQIADGMVYVCTSQVLPSPLTPQTSHSEYSCLDAYTGQVIWMLNKEFGAGPFDFCAIAYGNLYAFDSSLFGGNSGTNVLYCFGPPQDWSTFLGNPAHTATGFGGPVTMALSWKFTTGGQVISSPAVVNGKVYIGSTDKNWYCLDANTGAKIWSFTAGYYIRSSAAVVNGLMYTGADDGFVYCLNANTGTLVWKTAAPGSVLPINTGTEDEFRSSPTVVNGMVYVGALDGKLYCLDANSGNIDWTIQTTGAILSTPTYIAGDGLYFASVDGFVYKVNPSTGSIIWNQSTPIGREIAMMGTPAVGGGMVFIGSGAANGGPAGIGQFYGLNATTGKSVWTTSELPGSGSLEPIWSMIYNNGIVYTGDFFSFSALNVTTGAKIWSCFLTREHLGSPAYADGKFYVPSDSYGVYVVNATGGQKMGYFGTAAQVRSSIAIYDNKVYFGCNDWSVYCVGQSQTGTTYYGSTPKPSVTTPNTSPSTTTAAPAPLVISAASNAINPTSSESSVNQTSPTTYLTISAVSIAIAVVALATSVFRTRKKK